jgi:hypothetical protein
MAHVVGAAGYGVPIPSVHHIERERRLHGNRGVQSGRRRPRFETYARDIFALRSGGAERHASPVAGEHVASGARAFQLHLEPLYR